MNLNVGEFIEAFAYAKDSNKESKKIEEISDEIVIQKYDSSIDIKQLNKNIKEIKVWIEENLQKTFKDWYDKYINGVYENLTEYQEIYLNYLPILFNDLSKDEASSFKGKKVSDLINLLNDKGKTTQAELLSNLGFDKFEIVEYIDDEYDEKTNPNGTDYNGLVIKDINNNYILINSCTEEGKDVSFDAYKVYQKLIPEECKKNFGDFGLEDIYNAQINKGIEVAEKYFDIAAKNGTTLNIAGYSLGGGISEEIYLHLLTKKKFLPVKQQQNFNVPKHYQDILYSPLGTLNIYNAYHAYLDDKEVDLLLNQAKNNKVNMYANVGDMASSIFDYEKYEKITKFIYVDTDSIFEDLREQHLSEAEFNALNGDDQKKYLNSRPIFSALNGETFNVLNTLLKRLSYGYKNQLSRYDKAHPLNYYYDEELFKSLLYLDDIFIGGGTHDIYLPNKYKELAFTKRGEVIPNQGMPFYEVTGKLYNEVPEGQTLGYVNGISVLDEFSEAFSTNKAQRFAEYINQGMNLIMEEIENIKSITSSSTLGTEAWLGRSFTGHMTKETLDVFGLKDELVNAFHYYPVVESVSNIAGIINELTDMLEYTSEEKKELFDYIENILIENDIVDKEIAHVFKEALYENQGTFEIVDEYLFPTDEMTDPEGYEYPDGYETNITEGNGRYINYRVPKIANPDEIEHLPYENLPANPSNVIQ